jgi:sigma-B regulation protein RsbU (phosphoserine phosphatase)
LSIDSFITVPLVIAALAALILFLLLAIVRIRRTAKTSFIFFAVLLVLAAGLLYACISGHIVYLVFAVIACEILILPYLVILAFSSPEKREQKAKQKASAEAAKNSADAAGGQERSASDEKYKEIIAINKDFTTKAANMFSDEDSMDKFLDYFNKELTEKTHADGCVILLADEFDNILAVRSMTGTFPPPYKLPDDLPHKPVRVETNFRYAQFQLSDNVFGSIASGAEPVLIPDSSKDPRIYQNGPEDFLECGSYIFIPIKLQDEVIGVASLSRKPGDNKFGNEEFEAAKVITDAASTALKPLYSFLEYTEHRELTKEGDIASKFQKELLPEKIPVISRVSIGCWSQPAENVCGDYYDIIVSRKDRISFIMADIAGKGMNSLVIMVMVRAMLRLIVNTAQSAATILGWANRGICSENATIDHFASVALVNYNSVTGEAQIASCGINPVLLYSEKEHAVKKISVSSEPLGVEKDSVYKDINIRLGNGDILITCTDGLLESLNEFGIQYSLTSLMKVVEANHQLSGRDIANRVKEDIKKYCGNAQQYDDQSLMVVKIQG